MSVEKPKNLQKLEAKRVQSHVAEILAAIQLVGEGDRAALRARNILAPTWETLDLYTMAVDLCDDDELRFLVGQARAAILADLITRSANQRSSRFRDSSREG